MNTEPLSPAIGDGEDKVGEGNMMMLPNDLMENAVLEVSWEKEERGTIRKIRIKKNLLPCVKIMVKGKIKWRLQK